MRTSPSPCRRAAGRRDGAPPHTPPTPRHLAAVTVAIALASLVLAGCGTVDDDLPAGDIGEDPEAIEDHEDGAQPDDSEGSDVDDSTDHGDAEDGTSPEVRSAIAHAAERTDTDPAAIEVLSFEEVTWSDGSMGCPEPGQMYTQALVEGYRIVLEVEGSELTYHGAQGEDPFLCEAPEEPLERRD